MAIRNYNKIQPQIHQTAYIDPQACIIGDVQIGQNSSVWPMTVIRGDVNFIRIGANTNIQDGSILHVTHKGKYSHGSSLIVGDGVTVGHGVILHACNIHDYCLIGMGATIMDDSIIENHSIIAAGSVLPPNKHVKSGELWLGNPAKKIRDLNQEDRDKIEYSAHNYVQLKNQYQKNQL